MGGRDPLGPLGVSDSEPLPRLQEGEELNREIEGPPV